MRKRPAVADTFLSRAGALILVEHLGAVALGLALERFGHMGEWALVAAMLLNLVAAWYIFLAARGRGRRRPFLYGGAAALGPPAALIAYGVLRAASSLDLLKRTRRDVA